MIERKQTENKRQSAWICKIWSNLTWHRKIAYDTINPNREKIENNVNLIIDVTDTGIGMSQKKLESVILNWKIIVPIQMIIWIVGL